VSPPFQAPVSITHAAVSPDGLSAAATADGVVYLFDARTGLLKGTFQGTKGEIRPLVLPRAATSRIASHGRQGEVHGLAFRLGGRQLVAGGADRTVRVWDVSTGKLLRELSGPRTAVVSVAVHPGNGQVVAATLDGAVLVWDDTSAEPTVRLPGHVDAVHALCFSPDGRRLASAGVDRRVRVWDTEAWQEVLTLSGPEGGVACVTFSADGRRLAAGGADGAVCVWNASPRQPTGQAVSATRKPVREYRRRQAPQTASEIPVPLAVKTWARGGLLPPLIDALNQAGGATAVRGGRSCFVRSVRCWN
jgi:WD40 repeat protein